jgi:hypothetical protein
MNTPCRTVLLTTTIAFICVPSQAADLAPLEIKLPPPVFTGTPTDIPITPHMEPYTDDDRKPFLVPRGTVLLSYGKPVTSSDSNPISGDLEQITDGNKEASDSNLVELHRKLQWVQIDLESAATIHAIVVWHAFNIAQVTHDVVVRVADDAEFTKNVRTVFNNDYDNSAGLGIGQDKEYFEKHEGRLMDAKGQVARFVRLYSQGCTDTALNRYIEVEVFGIANPSR